MGFTTIVRGLLNGLFLWKTSPVIWCPNGYKKFSSCWISSPFLSGNSIFSILLSLKWFDSNMIWKTGDDFVSIYLCTKYSRPSTISTRSAGRVKSQNFLATFEGDDLNTLILPKEEHVSKMGSIYLVRTQFSEKLTLLTQGYAHVCALTCAYQRVKNDTFSEIF